MVDAVEAGKGRRQQDWPEYPLIKCLDEILKPRSFRRHGRIWRNDAPSTIQAIQLHDFEGGAFELRFCVWLKLMGSVATREVKAPWGKFHIFHTSGDVLPERLQFRMLRALHLKRDYAERIRDLYPEDIVRRLEAYFEPSEVLTPEWRCNTLNQAVGEVILPYLARIEANPEAFKPPTDPFANLETWIVEGRRRSGEGVAQDELVHWLRDEGMPTEKIALTLSEIFDMTPPEFARTALDLAQRFPED